MCPCISHTTCHSSWPALSALFWRLLHSGRQQSWSGHKNSRSECGNSISLKSTSERLYPAKSEDLGTSLFPMSVRPPHERKKYPLLDGPYPILRRLSLFNEQRILLTNALLRTSIASTLRQIKGSLCSVVHLSRSGLRDRPTLEHDAHSEARCLRLSHLPPGSAHVLHRTKSPLLRPLNFVAKFLIAQIVYERERYRGVQCLGSFKLHVHQFSAS